jgi:hypothetical protein
MIGRERNSSATVAWQGFAVSGMEVSVMADAFSPKQQFANFERGFEFSRLHEEWMAATYALVVPGRRRSEREVAPGVDFEPGKRAPQRRSHNTERRAG